MSLANRIALLAACAVGIAVAVASLAAYVTLRKQLHDRLDESLLARAHQVAKLNLASIPEFSVSSRLLGASRDVYFYVIYPKRDRQYPAG